MSRIRHQCPECGEAIDSDVNLAGMTRSCPACRYPQIIVPGGSTRPSSAPPPASPAYDNDYDPRDRYRQSNDYDPRDRYRQPIGNEPIQCPECGHPSDSIKCYRMGIILFLLIVSSFSTSNTLGCPACIRAKIAKFMAINLLTANILWPFMILPWGIVMLLRSFTRGHSSAVRNLLR